MGKEFEAGELGPHETANTLLEVFQGLSHSVRLEIHPFLMAKQYSVGEQYEILELTKYALSRQLALMQKAEIVETLRDARHIIYFLINNKVQCI